MNPAKTLLFLCFIVVAFAAVPLSSGRGWNDKIEWYSYSEGLKQAKETGKDMMILFHSTRCGACKRLQPDFASNKDVESLSKNFVMVNVENDEEPSKDNTFLKDGGYIPRVYFTDSNGKPDYSVTSGNSKYLYFYGGASQIAQQMKAVSKQ